MGEIRIVCPGKTRGFPYPVCKKKGISVVTADALLSHSSCLQLLHRKTDYILYPIKAKSHLILTEDMELLNTDNILNSKRNTKTCYLKIKFLEFNIYYF